MAIDLSQLTKIGTYMVNSCLGSNGVVATYDVTSLQAERFCLVAMAREQLAQPTAWNQAEQAAQRLQSGMPYGILVPEQWGQENDVYYMVYPFIEGTHLGGLINRSGLPTPFQAIDIALRLLENLKQLHNLGVSHRVINPASIFLPDGGLPVLLHGGWSRMLVNAQNGPLNENLMSNLPFLAPEIILQEGADFPADVYSLGANLYFLLTGQPLFWDDSPQTLGDQIVAQEPDLTPLNVLNSPDLNDLIEEMLEKDPEDRPPNLDALTNRLLNIQNAFPKPAGFGEEAESYSEQATIRMDSSTMNPDETSQAGSDLDPTIVPGRGSAADYEKPPSARDLHKQSKRKNQQEQLQRAQEAAEMAKLEKQRQAELEKQNAIEKQKEEMKKKRAVVKKLLLLAGLLLVVAGIAGLFYGIYAYINNEEVQGQENIQVIRQQQEKEAQKIKQLKEAEMQLAQTKALLTTVGTVNLNYLKKYGIWPLTFDKLNELDPAGMPEALEDSWGTPLQLRPQGFIVSAGPDAKFDSKDDLWINSANLELGP